MAYSLSSLLESAWHTTWDNLRTILFASLLYMGLPMLVGGLIMAWAPQDDPWILGPVFFLYMLVIIVFSIIFTAGLMKSIMVGSISWESIKEQGMRWGWHIVGVGILVSLILLAIFVAFGIPGALSIALLQWWSIPIVLVLGVAWLIVTIIVQARLTFAPYLVLDEKAGITESLKASAALTKGHMWNIVGYLIILFLISVGIGLAIGIILVPLSLLTMGLEYLVSTQIAMTWDALVQALSATLQGLLTCFSIAFLADFYRELKPGPMAKRQAIRKR